MQHQSARSLYRFTRRYALLCPLVMAASAAQTVDDLPRRETILLTGHTFHVQGIDVQGSTLWLSSVDKQGKRGILFQYRLPQGELIRSVEVQESARYHPGGICLDGDSLWIPVAEYRKESTAAIQRRNARTLALEQSFTVPDHIGAVTAVPEGILGVNWDAKDLYVWDRSGKLLRRMPNSTGIAFQDIKYADGQLIGGGLLPDKTGAVGWFTWPGLQSVRQLPAGKTDRGVPYTNEGMAVRNGKLWLLPEDEPSRLFMWPLP